MARSLSLSLYQETHRFLYLDLSIDSERDIGKEQVLMPISRKKVLRDFKFNLLGF